MSNQPLQHFTIRSENFEVMQKFILLGSVVENEGDCRKEMARRLALGRAAARGLEKIWRDRDLCVATKSRLMSALVFPVATYGCETWTLRKIDREKRNSFEHWC